MKSFMVCTPYTSLTIKWAGDLAHTDEKRERARFLVRNSEERNYLGDSSILVYHRIIIAVIDWVDKVNYTAQKTWNALHFIMHIPKKENNIKKSSAFTLLVGPILECGAA